MKTIAGALKKVLMRPTDFAARYGGEEFACILPETDLQGAQVTAERIASVLKGLDIPHATSQVSSRVTVSIGVAAVVPAKEQSHTFLLETADLMLYDAKHRGRNRISSGGTS